jgi:hypothetical protein
LIGLIAISICFLIQENTGCASQNEDNKKVNTMDTRSVDAFAGIKHGDDNPNKCTPEISDDFIGIKINTPEKITWTAADKNPVTNAFSRVMLCGIYHLSAIDLDDTKGFHLSASLIATNIKTHKNYIRFINKIPNEIKNPNRQQHSAKELEGLSVIGYFNIDIVEVLGLPEEAAEYLVFVIFKSFKSNVRKIILEPAK